MSGVLIVAKPEGSITTNGAGIVESQDLAYAGHTGITHEFRIPLSKTANLFSAFSWEDVNTEGDIDVSSGDTNFTIALDEAKFKAALQAVIEGATGGKSTATFDLFTDHTSVPAARTVAAWGNLGSDISNCRTILDREVRKEVENLLDSNNVLEYLEGDSLGEFSLTLDASGAAADMYSKLMADNGKRMRNLFLQIPNRNSEVAYTDASGSRLPVKEGDAVAFVFGTAPAVTITQRRQDAEGVNAADSNGGVTEPALSLPNPLYTATEVVSMNAGYRRIAFVIDVTA